MSTMKIGFNTFYDDVAEDALSFTRTAACGADFVVCHFNPFKQTVADACAQAKDVAAKLKEKGLSFIANFESQNFHKEVSSPDGYDWANAEQGTHRLRLPQEYVDALASCGNLMGLMYDEFEHTIINRNLSLYLDSDGKDDIPVFRTYEGKDPVAQSRLLARQVADYAAGMKALGFGTMYGEHVFPVLFHLFAGNGIIPNFKSQKESYSNVQFATAAGAALQYGTPLSNCVDMWFRGNHPGHTPDEMAANLAFAYHAGVNTVYVESAMAFVSKNAEGKKEYNAWGEAFCHFAQEYKDKPRSYDVADYRPEIGIVTMDDTYWGQGTPFTREKIHWVNMLFGNHNIRPTRASHEWIHAFHLISQGDTGRENISWNRINLWSAKHPHRSFAAMNSAVVFDENVREECLSSLKLCFLCGSYISDETLAAVEKLVREKGLTVVTTRRFLPKNVRKKYAGYLREIRDGQGKWIAVPFFGGTPLKKRIQPFLGERGQIRLTFKQGEVVLQIADNGETFSVVKSI